jgi:hypothetical protein
VDPNRKVLVQGVGQNLLPTAQAWRLGWPGPPIHHGVDYRKRHRTVEQMSQPNVRERGETVTSIRQAAAVRNVSPPVVRRWMLIVPVRGAQVDLNAVGVARSRQVIHA